MLKTLNLRDIQNFRGLLVSAQVAGLDLVLLTKEIDIELASRSESLIVSAAKPATRHRPDNIIACAICGKPAVIVPLPIADRTKTATHAIQCQNRPATDQPWSEGMCGHTEYIVRGNK
ncbi:hypothetical protein JT06_15835 [Desulfobulbus sp. Tol-SR]|nr:hypothetical protein JT06_15835 [Desulfobulbus sp. Tol-SR]